MIETKTAPNLPNFLPCCSFGIMLRCGSLCLLALCGSVVLMVVSWWWFVSKIKSAKLCSFCCILKAWHMGANMIHGCKRGLGIIGGRGGAFGWTLGFGHVWDRRIWPVTSQVRIVRKPANSGTCCTKCDQYRIAGVVVCINWRAKTWHAGAVSFYNMFLDYRLIRILRLRWTDRHSLV